MTTQGSGQKQCLLVNNINKSDKFLLTRNCNECHICRSSCNNLRLEGRIGQISEGFLPSLKLSSNNGERVPEHEDSVFLHEVRVEFLPLNCSSTGLISHQYGIEKYGRLIQINKWINISTK
jgi:hypothetical protein